MTILFALSHVKKSLQWLWYAEELKRNGIKQVYVIIDSQKDPEIYLAEDLRKLDLPVYVLPHKSKSSHLVNIAKTRRLIREHKVDIVHTTLPFGNLVGQLAARLERVKRITTCENVSWAHDFKSRKQERLDNFTFKSSQRIIATSDIATDYLQKNWHFNKEKLCTIYHGVNPADYQVSSDRVATVQKEVAIDRSREFVVGVISRFEFWKGHEFIIDAASKLMDIPDLKIYIFGAKGSYFTEAMKRIAELGLSDKVIYGGFVNDTSALYSLFDVHLHVPIDEYVETGGITIIEGMMAERTQVLTLSGYAYQSARHMHNAYVVPFKDADAIATALRWVKSNPGEARELAAQARKDAHQFSVQEKVKKHIALYEELLQ